MIVICDKCGKELKGSNIKYCSCCGNKISKLNKDNYREKYNTTLSKNRKIMCPICCKLVNPIVKEGWYYCSLCSRKIQKEAFEFDKESIQCRKNKKIEEMKKEIEEKKKSDEFYYICDKCNRVIKYSSKFCKYCGEINKQKNFNSDENFTSIKIQLTSTNKYIAGSPNDLIGTPRTIYLDGEEIGKMGAEDVKIFVTKLKGKHILTIYRNSDIFNCSQIDIPLVIESCKEFNIKVVFGYKITYEFLN